MCSVARGLQILPVQLALEQMRHDLSVLDYCLGALHNLATYPGNQATQCPQVLKELGVKGSETVEMLKASSTQWPRPRAWCELSLPQAALRTAGAVRTLRDAGASGEGSPGWMGKEGSGSCWCPSSSRRSKPAS